MITGSRGLGAQLAQHLGAVQAGQAEIEDQQVEVLVAGERDRRRPVVDDVVAKPSARRPFSRNDDEARSSSTIRMRLITASVGDRDR